MARNKNYMISRQDYINDKITFNDYYSQFITPEMVEQVKAKIGIDRIKASKDEHLNDIPLREWDGLSGCSFMNGQLINPPKVSKEFKELCKQADEWICPATLVCVYKTIARQLIEK